MIQVHPEGPKGEGVVGAGNRLTTALWEQDGASEDLAFWRAGCHQAQGTESTRASVTPGPHGPDATKQGRWGLQAAGAGDPGELLDCSGLLCGHLSLAYWQEFLKGRTQGWRPHILSCPWLPPPQLPRLCQSSASPPLPIQACLGMPPSAQLPFPAPRLALTRRSCV